MLNQSSNKLAQHFPAMPISSGSMALILLMALTYAYFHPGSDPNQSTRLFVTRALVERQAIDITPDHAKTGDKSEVDGIFYSDKAPGVSFLATLPYGLIKLCDKLFDIDDTLPVKRTKLHVISVAISGTAGVLAALLLLKCLLLLGATESQAQLLTVGYGLGTLMFPYSTMLFGHVAAAAMILATFFIIIRAESRDLSPYELTLCGLLWASAIITEYPVGLLVAVQGSYLLVQQRNHVKNMIRILAWSAVGATLPFLLHAIYTWNAFGSPLTTPYGYIFEPAFRAHHSGSFFQLPSMEIGFGVFLSSYRGIFFFCPFLAWFFYGFSLWWQSSKRIEVAQLCALQVLAYSMFTCSYYAWHGGGSLGPRHLTPAIAFFVIPILPLLQRSKWTRWAVFASIAVSIALMLVCTGVLIHHPEPTANHNPFYSMVLPNLLFDNSSLNFQHFDTVLQRVDSSYNIGTLLGLGPQASIVLPFVIWLLFGAILWKRVQKS